MNKIVTILGARPQFIKAATVSRAFAQDGSIQEILLHTGQHFDSNMSDVFFDELGIPTPAYNLGIGGSLHGAMTGAQLAGIEEVLLIEKPNQVLVYGDTNSTLAGALAATKLHIPIAHIEAGLRSFNRRMPEEINRVVADHVSDALFAPTKVAMQNLAREGISINKCHQVGDVMLDAALLFGERAKQSSTILQQLDLKNGSYALATIHRAENTDDLKCLLVILKALGQFGQMMPVVWPMHPRTRKLIKQQELHGLFGKEVQVIDPVGYMDMVMLELNAAVIATDSGGVQKEAFFYRVPCVTIRGETEWVELEEAGWNRLVPPKDPEVLLEVLQTSIGSTGREVAPYGAGDAAKRIVKYLLMDLS